MDEKEKKEFYKDSRVIISFLIIIAFLAAFFVAPIPATITIVVIRLLKALK